MKPVNNLVAEKIMSYGKRLDAAERIPQPSLVQWYNYAPNDFTANVSPKYLTVTSEIFGQLNVGAKLRIKQVGDVSYRYFLIKCKTASDSRIYLLGGDNYTLIAASLIEIAVSELSNPTGWPAPSDLFIDGNSWYFDPTAGGSVTPGELKYTFSMDGARINIDISETTNLISSSNAYESVDCVAVFPTELQTPSGISTNQDLLTIGYGFANSTAWSPGGQNIVVLPSSRTTGENWPSFIEFRIVQYGSYVWGNSSGNAEIIDLKAFFSYQLLDS